MRPTQLDTAVEASTALRNGLAGVFRHGSHRAMRVNALLDTIDRYLALALVQQANDIVEGIDPDEIHKLRRWKAEAMAEQRKWDAVADRFTFGPKLLGRSIPEVVGEKIDQMRRLLAERARYIGALENVFCADGVPESVTDEMRRINDEEDL